MMEKMARAIMKRRMDCATPRPRRLVPRNDNKINKRGL